MSFKIQHIYQSERQNIPLLQKVKTIQYSEGVKLHKNAQHILLSSFILGILGPPGSGKSSIIEHFLTSQTFYSKRFQRVLFIGPTKYSNLIQDTYNTCSFLDINWIYQHIQEANKWKCQNMLIIMDDIIGQLKSKFNQPQCKALFFNRRHLLKQGCISIIVTSQKWSIFPKQLRAVINSLILFSVNKYQSEACYKQINAPVTKSKFISDISSFKNHQFYYINLKNKKIFNNKWRSL